MMFRWNTSNRRSWMCQPAPNVWTDITPAVQRGFLHRTLRFKQKKTTKKLTKRKYFSYDFLYLQKKNLNCFYDCIEY